MDNNQNGQLDYERHLNELKDESKKYFDVFDYMTVKQRVSSSGVKIIMAAQKIRC